MDDDTNPVSGEQERRRVLEMLQQGKISAAEADELLAALQGGSAIDGPRSPMSARNVGPRRGSASGLSAVAVRLAGVLAKTIGRLSITLGRVAGVLARLFGRVQAEGDPRER